MPIQLSYIVPVFNEESIIEATLYQFIRDFENMKSVVRNYEILVVDDGSKDKTATIVENFIAKHANKVRLIQLDRNYGIGPAILTGFANATMEWVSANCADRPFWTSDLRVLAPHFDQQDLIVICRTDRSANNWYRKLTSWGNCKLIQWIFWSRIHDFQFVQFYRRELLQNMKIISCGTITPPEMILKCQRLGARIVEIFLPFHKRPGGKSKYGHPKYIFMTLLEIVRLRIHLWKGSLGKRGKMFPKIISEP